MNSGNPEPHSPSTELPKKDPKENSLEAIIPTDVVRNEVNKQLANPEIMHQFGVQVAMGGSTNAFVEKLELQHIDKILDYTKDAKTQSHQRTLIFYIVGIIAFILLCGMFLYMGNDAILEKLVSAFIGFLGGYGIGSSKSK